jgi:hypothetical protein
MELTVKEYAEKVSKLAEKYPNLPVVAQHDFGVPYRAFAPYPCKLVNQDTQVIPDDGTEEFVPEAICIN